MPLPSALGYRPAASAGAVLNAKDAGATGNGTTDDTAAVQRVINASQPGDIVFFPQGTYKVSSTISLLKSRTYQGAGREKTIIQMANGANLDAVMASEQWLATGAAGTSDTPVNVLDLGISGNSGGQTSGAGHGLVVCSFWNNLHNLEIGYTRGDGLLVTGVRRDTTEITNTAVETRISRVSVRSAGGVGIHVQDPTPGTQSVTDGWIIDCIVASPASDGIRVESSAGWLVKGNHIYGTPKSGIVLGRAAYTRMLGNYCEDYGSTSTAGVYGAFCLGDNNTCWIGSAGGNVVSGNTAFHTSAIQAGVYLFGIITATATGATGEVVITGNAVTSTTGGYGIGVENQSGTATTYAQLGSNYLSGWSSGQRLDFSGGGATGAYRVQGSDYVRTVADTAVTLYGVEGTVAYTSLTASRVVTLPPVGVGTPDQPWGCVIKDQSGSCAVGKTITITPASGTIDGAANLALNSAYAKATVYTNGTNWFTR